MHNWRLLVLLITSLLQPILSECNAFDGRRCCSHSAHLSLEEESASLHGKYRIFRDLHLNTRRDVLRHELRDERRFERHILTPKDTQNDNGRQLEISSVQDVRSTAHRKSVLKHSDARNRDTSLDGRSINREILKQSRPTFNTHEEINHAFSEDFRIHDTSKTERTTSRYLRKSRSTVSQRSENGRDSNAQYIHKRDLTRDSDKILARTRITAERQDLLNYRKNERGIRQRDRDIRQVTDKHITSSFSRKLEFLEGDGQVSRVRDRSVSERIDNRISKKKLWDNIHVKADERDGRLSNPRQTNKQSNMERIDIRNLNSIVENNNERSAKFNRDMRQQVTKSTIARVHKAEQDHEIRHQNSREERPTKVTDNRRGTRENTSHRRVQNEPSHSRERNTNNVRNVSPDLDNSLERSLDNEVKVNERIIARRSREERYTNRRDKRTEFSSTDRYLRNSQRHARSAALDMRQLDDDTLPRRRFTLRNEELHRNLRDDGDRNRKYETELRQIRARDASFTRDMHRLENRQITEIDGTHNQEERNIFLRGEGNIIRSLRRSGHEVRTRAVSTGRFSRQQVSIKSTDERDARSYEVRDNETDERLEIRKIERHSRDKRAISVEREIPRLSSRVTDDRNNRIRQERNAMRAMRRYDSNVEKHSRMLTRDRVSLMLPHVREFTLQRNSNARNEHSRIRRAERYDHSQDRVVERERNNEIPNRMSKRQITWTIEERNTNLKDNRVTERGPNRKTIQMRERNDDLRRSMTTDARTNDKRIARHQDSQIRRTEGNLRTQNSVRNIQQSTLNRENEPPAYVDSKNSSDMKRDQSRRYTVFSVRTKVGTDSETKFSTMLHWQYLFYVIQGMYILDVIMQLFRQKEKYIKSSATNWFSASRHIKVE